MRGLITISVEGLVCGVVHVDQAGVDVHREEVSQTCVHTVVDLVAHCVVDFWNCVIFLCLRD